jgi:hypothetical protein
MTAARAEVSHLASALSQEPPASQAYPPDVAGSPVSQRRGNWRRRAWTAAARAAVTVKPILPGRADDNQAAAAARRGGQR